MWPIIRMNWSMMGYSRRHILHKTIIVLLAWISELMLKLKSLKLNSILISNKLQQLSVMLELKYKDLIKMEFGMIFTQYQILCTLEKIFGFLGLKLPLFIIKSDMSKISRPHQNSDLTVNWRNYKSMDNNIIILLRNPLLSPQLLVTLRYNPSI